MALPDVPPFTKLLGVNVLHRTAERTEAELTVREELCNHCMAERSWPWATRLAA